MKHAIIIAIIAAILAGCGQQQATAPEPGRVDTLYIDHGQVLHYDTMTCRMCYSRTDDNGWIEMYQSQLDTTGKAFTGYAEADFKIVLSNGYTYIKTIYCHYQEMYIGGSPVKLMFDGYVPSTGDCFVRLYWYKK